MPSLYLAPAALGQGLGQALFTTAVAELRACGFAELALWVLEGNDRAILFYERCGMKADVRAAKTVRAVSLMHARYRMPL